VKSGATWAPRGAAAALILHALSGTAGAQLLDCRGGQRASQVAELMFGRKIGDRIGVSEAAWRRFMAREIAPRFPDGLTVFDARGLWRDRSTNKLVREPSKVVHILLPGHAEDISRLDAIADAYKNRFKQQSVAVIVRPACVSF
jgi:hypothetical protein